MVTTSNGPDGRPPYTKGEAILTTYGLDDELRADLCDRRSGWRGAHY
jgi:hypothetical protein